MPQDAAVAQLFIKEVRTRLAASHQRIVHCVSQLSDQQLWWRPQDTMNSIANIILHLCGNVRQWIVSGVTGSDDNRNRPNEFTDRSMLATSELLTRLETIVSEADRILSGVNSNQLMEARRIQDFDETVMSAILNSVTHFNGHAQETVYITRLQLGSNYQYAWVPSSPEQGAPASTQ